MTAGPVEVSESCRCGGSTSVKAGSIRTARRHVEQWRSVHPCTSQQQELDGMRSGTTTTFLAGSMNEGRVGFQPEPGPPWGHRG